MKKILIYALIAAILAVVGLSYALRKERAEKDRYKANQTALLSEVEYYKTENGKNVASVQKLTLTYDELKQNYSQVCKVAKDLDIKLKRIQHTSTTTTETNVKVVAVVKDSIVYRDGALDSLRTFEWKDPWVKVSGEISSKAVDIDVYSTDTLIQIIHRIPHKWWFFKWGTKAIKQEVVSSNPHTQITYTEYIEIK